MPANELEMDLKDLISSHLPRQVGDALKKRLEDAAAVERELRALKEQHERTQHSLDAATKRMVEDEELRKRETAVQAREATVTLREQLISLREVHAKERVEEMRGVVKDVFSNHQFKYSVSSGGTWPVAMQPGAYPQSAGWSNSATGTGEGAPPPPPMSPQHG